MVGLPWPPREGVVVKCCRAGAGRDPAQVRTLPGAGEWGSVPHRLLLCQEMGNGEGFGSRRRGALGASLNDWAAPRECRNRAA